jgi:hypothetical protein
MCPAPNGMKAASYVVVVPLLGIELAAGVENTKSSWHRYIRAIQEAKISMPEKFGVFPYLMSTKATNGTQLGQILGKYQFIATGAVSEGGEGLQSMLCRDLSQGIAQLISSEGTSRLTTFISHTKRHSNVEGEDVDMLVQLVREIIRNTRLNEFFDANDLQPGENWSARLREQSGTSAMLAIRTDLYSSREWCQREIVIAKTHGMPVIMLDAIGYGEERGSFLMDHVPRVAVRKMLGQWDKRDVYRALNLLVDECLKRVIWSHQKELASEMPGLDVAWWAPHAPELITLVDWIDSRSEDQVINGGELRILHPDPPLGLEERQILVKYARQTRLGSEIDIMTPRQLAARGG